MRDWVTCYITREPLSYEGGQGSGSLFPSRCTGGVVSSSDYLLKVGCTYDPGPRQAKALEWIKRLVETRLKSRAVS